MKAPRETERPCPMFTREELIYLQGLLDGEREGRFNYYMETLNDDYLAKNKEEAHRKYLLAKELRNKIYHLGGRDTLAPGSHEQRHWDQGHDY